MFFKLIIYLFACGTLRALYLRAASVDRCETFRHDWMCVKLDNVGTKIRGLPPLSWKFFWGQLLFAFRPHIFELPQPIAAKLCQMTDDG